MTDEITTVDELRELQEPPTYAGYLEGPQGVIRILEASGTRSAGVNPDTITATAIMLEEDLERLEPIGFWTLVLKTDQEHAERTVEMFLWLEENSALQAMCPFCLSVGDLIGHFDTRFQHDGWIVEHDGQLAPRPVYEEMRRLRLGR